MKKLHLSMIIVLLLSAVSLVACGGDDDNQNNENGSHEAAVTQGDQETTNESEAKNSDEHEVVGGEESDTQQASGTGDLPWDDIPIYPGAELDVTNPCPPQWEECDTCERRVYMIDDNPKEVCEYYKEKMPDNGWEGKCKKYPEGACSGAWSKEMGNTSAPRVIIGIGQRSPSDETTSIGMTLGTGCP